jgi:PAS domain S-box-containing protein
MQIDFRTLFFSYFLSTLAGLVVLFIFWQQVKERYKGIGLILLEFVFLTLGILLIFLRGIISDFSSIILSNIFTTGGLLLGLIGLEILINIRGKHYHNFILLAIYSGIHYYFTFVDPNLPARNLNSSVIFLIYSIQYVLLMSVRVTNRKRRKKTLPISLIFTGFVIINIVKIISIFLNSNVSNDYLQSKPLEIFIIISSQILFLLFAYFLILLIIKLLWTDIEFQKEKFSKTFQATPFALLLTRIDDGKIKEVNNGFQEITGYSAAESFNKTTVELNLWEEPAFRKEFIDTLNHYGNVKEMEFNFRKKNGDLIKGSISAEILIIETDLFAISIISDITARKEAEVQLKKYAFELKQANDTKDKLFSIIGHDLRSPLNSIIGFSELIADEIENLDKTTISKFASTIHNSALNAQNLFQNLLEWAKVQQNSFGFFPTQCNISVLINEIIQLLTGSAQKKGVSINLTENSEAIIIADDNMLKTVIRNLISNSLKYTPQGGEIDIDLKNNIDQIIITVKDNGIGMDKETMDALFKPGIQSKEGTENERGTGLGLLLCKEFVERHSGRIWVESEKGKGSKFSFSIPK